MVPPQTYLTWQLGANRLLPPPLVPGGKIHQSLSRPFNTLIDLSQASRVQLHHRIQAAIKLEAELARGQVILANN